MRNICLVLRGLLCLAIPCIALGGSQKDLQETSIIFQRSLGARGTLVILQDHWDDTHWNYFGVIIDVRNSQVIDMGSAIISDSEDRVLDAFVPDNGAVITVYCDPSASVYYVGFADTRKIGLIGDVLRLPANSINPEKPLNARISEEDANKNTVVTFWDAKRHWKLRFDCAQRKWQVIEGVAPTTEGTGKGGTGKGDVTNLAN